MAKFDDIKEDFKYYFGTNVVEQDEEELRVTCRHWADWEIPDDEEDEEDCDSEVLTYESRIRLKKYMSELREKYPQYKINFEFSEKNYIDFTASDK